nr:hypothetical protein CFP56_78339 [Quercus suber]
MLRRMRAHPQAFVSCMFCGFLVVKLVTASARLVNCLPAQQPVATLYLGAQCWSLDARGMADFNEQEGKRTARPTNRYQLNISAGVRREQYICPHMNTSVSRRSLFVANQACLIRYSCGHGHDMERGQCIVQIHKHYLL